MLFSGQLIVTIYCDRGDETASNKLRVRVGRTTVCSIYLGAITYPLGASDGTGHATELTLVAGINGDEIVVM